MAMSDVFKNVMSIFNVNEDDDYDEYDDVYESDDNEYSDGGYDYIDDEYDDDYYDEEERVIKPKIIDKGSKQSKVRFYNKGLSKTKKVEENKYKHDDDLNTPYNPYAKNKMLLISMYSREDCKKANEKYLSGNIVMVDLKGCVDSELILTYLTGLADGTKGSVSAYGDVLILAPPGSKIDVYNN